MTFEHPNLCLVNISFNHDGTAAGFFQGDKHPRSKVVPSTSTDPMGPGRLPGHGRSLQAQMGCRCREMSRRVLGN